MAPINATICAFGDNDEQPVKRARIDDGAYETPQIDKRALTILRLREKLAVRHYVMRFWEQLNPSEVSIPFESTLLAAGPAPPAARICFVPGCDGEVKGNTGKRQTKYCDAHKTHFICRQDGCGKRSVYSFPFWAPQWCGDHKTSDMISATAPRCHTCGKSGAYQRPDQPGVWYCRPCGGEDAFNKTHKMCPICGDHLPYYEKPGEPGVKYCRGCAGKEGFDVHNNMCPTCGDHQPYFEKPDEPGVKYCRRCAGPQGVDVINKMCSMCDVKHATYEIPELPGLGFCRVCGGPDAVYIYEKIYKMCATCGNVQPCYEKPGEPGIRYCRSCAGDDAIDVIHKRCTHGRRLEHCLGQICHINNIGTRSIEEMFPDATAFIQWTGGDDIETFIHALSHRLQLGDLCIMPDMLVDKQAFFHDGHRYHAHKPKDALDAVALLGAGYTVTRTRDRLPDLQVPGVLNVSVNANKGHKEVSHDLATSLGVSDSDWPAMWRRAESLANRAILKLGDRYAQSRQTSIDDFFE
ncbi:hypothetical protein JKP88DRAFT_243868 [Tribonema minus]|uniref:Uncharacterized protein n=1 Tax=Tribonema minus TaxID=303371 RepID=A0A835ZBU2_9STRA|nr:hypothetical protein JKP88DRAFT_243868 [Tribonema minus]